MNSGIVRICAVYVTNLLAIKSGKIIMHLSFCNKFPQVAWRRGAVVITTTQVRSTKPDLRFCSGGSMTMASAGNKAKRLSSVNHTTKNIHHHRHQTIAIGLSNFHKSVVAILKMYLPNNQPKVGQKKEFVRKRSMHDAFSRYLIIKNFDNNRFSELLSEIKKLGPLKKNISIFHNVCIEVLQE